MKSFRGELSALPWAAVSTGHGLLTGTAVAGVVATGGPVRWVWLLVVAVGVAAAKRAWEDHTAAAVVSVDGQDPTGSRGADRSGPW